ncbi:MULTISPECIES: MtrAB system histidine kinase MtrB [unclassified Pseudonocardia]|uniref:MtrAB system histidine kinase MtrB n=1 Tax=unclassified Pseudonocardia TaxID=2619320 RepID=UPI0001FFE05E|nr:MULTISPECIES: MtrAB system histidine kinase MtrB [unclassified Pseudonocardia]OLM20531.1 Sensor histidine kinase MtrB [Pseudonocardia sp. Ae707_Ps1]
MSRGGLRRRLAGVPGVRRIARALAPLRAQAHELGALVAASWRRSLQLRVVVSTLALSTAVVLVLGLVLQSEITERLLQSKANGAFVQADTSRVVLEGELSGVDPDREGAQETLDSALQRLTNTQSSAPGSSAAGDYRAALTTGSGNGPEVSSGDVGQVTSELRDTVAEGGMGRQYVTVDGVPTLVIGQPVATAGRELQFYLLFPLEGERLTLNLVQSTLIVGGLVLLVLLAAIASLVTRQVVRPIRHAADVAERFAGGHLDERMAVRGEDEVARLAESYNEMAGSLAAQIAQLEEFGALQRRFTSDVSHELRTPLTTVRMAADVLYASRDELLPALRRSSELLVTELDRFEVLLADLLEISRLDAGVAELGAERIDLSAVVRHAVDAVRGLAADAGTELVLDLPEGEGVEADPRRVERIVRNLVANAIDHGEGQQVEVTMAGDPAAVAVVVRDHGVGLRPGEADLVFNRFWRAEESRARRSGGTGLGLSISIEDARLHGGWLQAWGEPGKGSAFRLTLPRQIGGHISTPPLPLGPPSGDDEAGTPRDGRAGSVPTPPRGISARRDDVRGPRDEPRPVHAEDAWQIRGDEHAPVQPAERAITDPGGDR